MSHDFNSTASAARELSNAGILARAIDNWRARRSVKALLRLDDHILHDMGTSREEIASVAHLPLSVNAALVLEERVRIANRH